MVAGVEDESSLTPEVDDLVFSRQTKIVCIPDGDGALSETVCATGVLLGLFGSWGDWCWCGVTYGVICGLNSSDWGSGGRMSELYLISSLYEYSESSSKGRIAKKS